MKHKIRIRRIRKMALAFILILIAVVIAWAVLSTNDEAETAETEVIPVDPKLTHESEMMTAVIDSFIHSPQRLDTTKMSISIYDITAMRQVYAMHDQQLLPPASCIKLPTAVAAMELLGMDCKMNASLLAKGTMKGDTLIGNLCLKADPNPLIESIDTLTWQLRKAGIRSIRGSISLDLALEDTLMEHPSAKTWDIPYNKTPVLLKGKEFVMKAFRYSLQQQGIAVKDDVSVKAQGEQRVVASVDTEIQNIIRYMLIFSSNIKAEALFFYLDRKQGIVKDRKQHWTTPHAVETCLRGIFCDPVKAEDDEEKATESKKKRTKLPADLNPTTRTMAGFVINDGSGLSPENRVTASFLVDVLRYAYANEQMRNFLIDKGMATPGDPDRTGSLHGRMLKPEFIGRIYGKTGTMTTIGGSSLAGYLHGKDGHWYAYCIINNDSPVYESRRFQDRLCGLMVK